MKAFTTTVGMIAASACLALTGCSVSFGKMHPAGGDSSSAESPSTSSGSSAGLKVSQSELAARVKAMEEEKVGQKLDAVSCNGDLQGTVGATQRCTLSVGDGQTIGTTITVKSVNGTHIKFSFANDQKVTPAPAGS